MVRDGSTMTACMGAVGGSRHVCTPPACPRRVHAWPANPQPGLTLGGQLHMGHQPVGGQGVAAGAAVPQARLVLVAPLPGQEDVPPREHDALGARQGGQAAVGRHLRGARRGAEAP